MESIRGLSSILHTTFNCSCSKTFKKTDACFATLLFVQWTFAIVLAVFISPPAYKGMDSVIHNNVWTALIFGGVLAFVACSFALINAGEEITRHVVAIAQVLMAVLFVYLIDGRVEGTLLLLASFVLLTFYRDWRVLVTAIIVIGGSSQFIAATHQLL